jgi:anti-anti-sigma factor
MSITVNIHGSTANIILSGGIDYSTQELFREANYRALNANGVREIQVHFSEVTFIDSSCIRALLVLQKQVEERGLTLSLLDCNDSIREIFEIGGFDKMFLLR